MITSPRDGKIPHQVSAELVITYTTHDSGFLLVRTTLPITNEHLWFQSGHLYSRQMSTTRARTRAAVAAAAAAASSPATATPTSTSPTQTQTPSSEKENLNSATTRTTSSTKPSTKSHSTTPKSKSKPATSAVLYCTCSKGDDGSPMIRCAECKTWCVSFLLFSLHPHASQGFFFWLNTGTISSASIWAKGRRRI
jgi:hypothetical protein